MLSSRDLDLLASGRHGDPFSVLGPHLDASGQREVRAFAPGAVQLVALAQGRAWPLAALGNSGVFAGPVPGSGD